MPNYVAFEVFEILTFNGQLNDIAAISGFQVSTKKRSGPGPYGADVEVFEGPDGREITAGALYRRSARQLDPSNPASAVETGPWKYVGQTWGPEIQAARPAKLDGKPPVAAGQPMRSPAGNRVFLQADGTTPLQPASGAPGRHPYTGELTGSPQP